MIDKSLLEKLTPVTAEEQAALSGRLSIDRSLYMAGDRDIISGSKLLEDGRLITVRPHTRFVAFPEHTHDYVEMVYMCAGSTTHLVNGTRLTLGEGELLILGRSARQAIEPAGEGDIAVNFIVRPEFFNGTLPYLGAEETPLRRFIVDCLCGGEGENYLRFQVAGILPVQNLLENLLWTALNEVPNRRDALQMTMGLLFNQLITCADRISAGSPEQDTTVQVLRYIEANYRDGSLSEIAEKLHYEITWLSRLIKKRTGKSFTELMQEKRLTQAAWLLKNTDKQVEDIALAVGYENLSYFYRIFAARWGKTPRSWRICK